MSAISDAAVAAAKNVLWGVGYHAHPDIIRLALTAAGEHDDADQALAEARRERDAVKSRSELDWQAFLSIDRALSAALGDGDGDRSHDGFSGDVELLAAQRDRSAAQMAKARALVRDFADSRGVNVGDEDGDWWRGYRQAQREALMDASELAARVLSAIEPAS